MKNKIVYLLALLHYNIDQIRGMDICVNTSANNPADAKVLLEELNFPFKK